jgi:hypothetical protein
LPQKKCPILRQNVGLKDHIPVSVDRKLMLP